MNTNGLILSHIVGAVCAVSQSAEKDMTQLDSQCLESEEMSAAIGRHMGWGPLNCGAAVRANFCCEYCGRSLLASLDDYYSWEVDHIVPGGPDSLENYALSCHTCNHLKHFYAPLGESREMRLQDVRQEVQRRRQKKQAELDQLRQIIGSIA